MSPGAAVSRARTLRLRRLEHLALRLNVPLDFLLELHDDHAACYRSFEKVIGHKRRKLYDPNRRLRAALVAVKDLLSTLWLPDPIVGGRRGMSIRDFALPHVGKPVVLELDIADFYPSVKHKWVYNLFHRDLDCSPDVARVLTRLTTADGHLPQGFNTSTHIGNLLIRRPIERLAKLGEPHGAHVTVWVDNIVVSGPGHTAGLAQLMRHIVGTQGFRTHPANVMPNTGAQTICGVTVNNRLSSHRAKRELIEADIRELEAGRVCDLCQEFGDADRLYRRFQGRISDVGQVNRRQARRLRYMLRSASVDWNCNCRAPIRVPHVITTCPAPGPRACDPRPSAEPA